MKTILRKRLNWFTPGREGWDEYALECIRAEICPNCGNDLFSKETSAENEPGNTSLFICSVCDWNNADYVKIFPLKATRRLHRGREIFS
jgi:hypothetical protein